MKTIFFAIAIAVASVSLLGAIKETTVKNVETKVSVRQAAIEAALGNIGE